MMTPPVAAALLHVRTKPGILKRAEENNDSNSFFYPAAQQISMKWLFAHPEYRSIILAGRATFY